MATVNIPIDCGSKIYQGDTIKEITFSFAADDNIDLVGSTIRMQLYLGSSKKLDISSGSGITIVDGKTFKIDQIDYMDNDLPFGVLKGDLEITDIGGVRLTYLDVIYKITKDLTV